MKIAYYIENPGIARMTSLSIASAREVMSDVEAIQLSPARLPKAEGVDRHVVTPEEGHFFARRVIANAMLDDPEILFPDSDTIFREDVRHVFDAEFDVALPEIVDPDVRYSAGIVFSRSPQFWADQAEMELRRTSDGLPFTKDLLVFFTTFVDGWKREVLRLPEARYEYVPRRADDQCVGAAIVHYRGPRKKWMPGYTGWPIETVFYNY